MDIVLGYVRLWEGGPNSDPYRFSREHAWLALIASYAVLRCAMRLVGKGGPSRDPCRVSRELANAVVCFGVLRCGVLRCGVLCDKPGRRGRPQQRPLPILT